MISQSFDPGWLIALGSISSAVIGFVSIRLAWKSHLETLDQKRPRIRVTIVSSQRFNSRLQIIIENIGKSTAFDIQPTTPEQVPYGVKHDGNKVSISFMTKGPLTNKIAALAAGDRRVVDWGNMHELREAFKVYGRDFIPVMFDFTDAQRKPYRDHSILEVASFEGCVPEIDPIADLAREVGELKRVVRKSSNKPMRLEVKR